MPEFMAVEIDSHQLQHVQNHIAPSLTLLQRSKKRIQPNENKTTWMCLAQLLQLSNAQCVGPGI